jgi:hypothetical protein
MEDDALLAFVTDATKSGQGTGLRPDLRAEKQ